MSEANPLTVERDPSAAVVCPLRGPKPLPSTPAEKQRRYRLRKQADQLGMDTPYTECQWCSKPIKPSFVRGFCPGGKCRRQLSKQAEDEAKAKAGVLRVIPIDSASHYISQAVLEGGN
jgi:hypothetical protein